MVESGVVAAAVVGCAVLGGCGGASAEKLRERAAEKDRAVCTKELTELKGKLDGLDTSLWGDFSDCMKVAAAVDKESVRACVGHGSLERLSEKK